MLIDNSETIKVAPDSILALLMTQPKINGLYHRKHLYSLKHMDDIDFKNTDQLVNLLKTAKASELSKKPLTKVLDNECAAQKNQQLTSNNTFSNN